MIALLLPLLVGAVVLGVALAASAFLARTDARRLERLARRAGPLVMLGAAALLALRGERVIAAALLRDVLAQRAARAAAGFGTAGAAGTGRAHPGAGGPRSSVRTATLDATLDHATGEIDAVVRRGRFAGRQLTGMTKPEALGLWADCAADIDSRSVVEAYLDRRHPEWRQDVERDGHAGASGAGGARRPDRGGAMTEQRAREVLGLSPGATEAEIRQAHRRLMKEFHPDQGGDTARAAEINAAKDVLLGRRRR